jgi:hypothetical protein
VPVTPAVQVALVITGKLAVIVAKVIPADPDPHTKVPPLEQ